jgi:hypothetical protein
MIGRDELTKFKKMWTWLCGYPAHDREYYMKYVVKLDHWWINSCPISNESAEKDCDGCKELWPPGKGTLCTDPCAPLHKWKNTPRHSPDYRSFYASQVAVLAMKHIQNRYSEAV